MQLCVFISMCQNVRKKWDPVLLDPGKVCITNLFIVLLLVNFLVEHMFEWIILSGLLMKSIFILCGSSCYVVNRHLEFWLPYTRSPNP